MAETTRYLKINIPEITVDNQADAAAKINDGIRKIDSHDHGVNSGSRICFSQINIDDINFEAINIIGVSEISFSNASEAKISSDGNVLTFFNGSLSIAITSINGVNINIPFNSNLIFGDYATAGAQIKYSQSAASYRMQRSATDNQNADVTARTFTIKEGSQNSITLNNLTTLTSNETITLPTLPTSTRPLNITPTGQINTTNIPISAWVSGTAYSTGDKVTFRGAIWQRTADVQSSLTLSPLQDRAAWIKSSGDLVFDTLFSGNTEIGFNAESVIAFNTIGYNFYFLSLTGQFGENRVYIPRFLFTFGIGGLTLAARLGGSELFYLQIRFLNTGLSLSIRGVGLNISSSARIVAIEGVR